MQTIVDQELNDVEEKDDLDRENRCDSVYGDDDGSGDKTKIAQVAQFYSLAYTKAHRESAQTWIGF